MIPDQPKWPDWPVLGGMNGCQLAEWMALAAPAMNSSTTATFTMTMMLLKLADSLMPTTSSVVTTKMMIIAGKLKMAVTCDRAVGSVPSAWICSARPVPNAVQPAFIFSPEASATGRSINSVPRAAASWGGTTIPKSRRKDTTYPDQPTATVMAPTAYSSSMLHPDPK